MDLIMFRSQYNTTTDFRMSVEQGCCPVYTPLKISKEFISATILQIGFIS